jgi:hypothetical protein
MWTAACTITVPEKARAEFTAVALETSTTTITTKAAVATTII